VTKSWLMRLLQRGPQEPSVHDEPAVTSNEPALSEGVDYEIDAAGQLVFTAAYLLRRGTCCDNGCRHCPYGPSGSEGETAD